MPDPGPEEFSQVLFKVADLLEGVRAPYMIFGAVAVGVWGRIRTTLDVDFLVQTDEEGLSRLETTAESSGIGGFRADVVRATDAHDRAAMERRRQVSWRGRSLWVVSPEDLILQKIRAQRDYDFRAAVSVIEEQKGRLDEEHLDLWARRPYVG